jgi:uridine phosphorylase
MSFPNHPDKHAYESLLDPQDIVNYRRHLGRMPEINFPEGLLFCLERGLPWRLRRRIPIRHAGSMLGELYEVKRPKNKVAVMVNFGGGSPIVAELAEECIVMGAKRIALMTWGGALQPDLKAGDIVVCDQAVRDEGTSHHYLPPSRSLSASPVLVEKLSAAIRSRGGNCSTGATWTTDAPYRETPEEVRTYQSEGVKTVEMEAAGLFAVGQVREVQTAAVVVVMDSLARLRWEVPDDLNAIMRSLEIVYSASIDVLSQP